MKIRRLLMVPAVVGSVLGAAVLGTPATTASAHEFVQTCFVHQHKVHGRWVHHRHCFKQANVAVIRIDGNNNHVHVTQTNVAQKARNARATVRNVHTHR